MSFLLLFLILVSLSVVSAVDSDTIGGDLDLSQSEDVVGIDVSSANEENSISDTQKSISSTTCLNSSEVETSKNRNLSNANTATGNKDKISIRFNNADILSASDDHEILKDYNYDYWDGQYWYYDDTLTGTILVNNSGSYNVGDTVFLKLGTEKTNWWYGDEYTKVFIRMDGETNRDNWDFVDATYTQVTSGIPYTLKIAGNHYIQIGIEAYGSSSTRWFAKGVNLWCWRSKFFKCAMDL